MKSWWKSRTIWANVIAVASMAIVDATGVTWLDAEGQLAILGVINLIMRALTKQPLTR